MVRIKLQKDIYHNFFLPKVKKKNCQCAAHYLSVPWVKRH